MKSSQIAVQKLRKQIKGIIKEYNNPGVAVVATRNTFPPLFEYYGGPGALVPGENWTIRNDSIFLIASVSKLITVATVLHCIERVNRQRQKENRKMLTVDSTIEGFLPFKFKNPKFPKHRITFQQLLDHTSGIVDNFEIEELLYTTNADSPINMGEFCRWYLTPIPKGKQGHTVPGHKNTLFYSKKNFDKPGVFSYSNAAYTLLGYLVECLCKKELNQTRYMWEYCDEHILEPMGIGTKGSFAGRFLFSQLKNSISKMARPGQRMPYYSFPGYANGGFRCTGPALGRIMSMFINGGTFQTKNKKVKILSKETMANVTNFTVRKTPWQTLYSYGFGFRTDLIKKLPPDAPLSSSMPQPRLAIGHTGGEHGVATCLYWVNDPQDARNSIGVLVLTNTNWPEVKNGAPLDIAIAVFDAFQGH